MIDAHRSAAKPGRAKRPRSASLESFRSVRSVWDDVLGQGRPQPGHWLAQSSVVVAVATAGLAIARFLVDGFQGAVAYALLGAAIGFGLAAMICRRRPTSTVGPTLLPVVGVVGTTAMALAEGGMQSEALYWSPFIPLVALLALGMRGALIFGGLVLLSTTLLALSQGYGLTGVEAGFTSKLVLRWLGLNTAVAFAVTLGAAYLRARAQSIAKLAAAKREADAAHDQLQVLVDNLPAGVAVTDDEDRLVVANQKLCEIFELPTEAAALEGRNKWDAIGAGGQALMASTGLQRPSLNLPVQRGESIGDELRFSDGRAYERDVVPLILRGNVLGHLWTYHDITRRTQRAAVMLAQIQRDELTGLASRSHFTDQCDRACDYEAPFAVLYLDLDGFKDINDTLGHAAGDEALRMVADRLLNVVRSDDVVARMGGDELAVLLRGVSTSRDAAVAGGKILGALKEPFPLEGAEVGLGASIGVAVYPRCGRTTDLLLEAADQAMYRAKRSGKGRMAVASGGLETGDTGRHSLSA